MEESFKVIVSKENQEKVWKVQQVDWYQLKNQPRCSIPFSPQEPNRSAAEAGSSFKAPRGRSLLPQRRRATGSHLLHTRRMETPHSIGMEDDAEGHKVEPHPSTASQNLLDAQMYRNKHQPHEVPTQSQSDTFLTSKDSPIGTPGCSTSADNTKVSMQADNHVPHAPTQMTVPQTLTIQDSKFLCGHSLLNPANRGQGVRMSPGLIKPCHFSPRAVMQSLTSAAMVANVLQALTDDSDSVSTTSPDSNFSLDSVECNLTPRSDNNNSVSAYKTGGTDAGVPKAMFGEINSGFGKHPAEEKGLSIPLGEGGGFCLIKNPSGGGEGGTPLANGELLIGNCEIDTELTSKEKTKQWLASPGTFLWKDDRKLGDQEVRGQDIEHLDDSDVKLTQDSLSGSPVVTPRSADINFQEEVEKLANMFTKLEAGSSAEELAGKALAQKSGKVKGRTSRESLRLPKQRTSSSSSVGRKSPTTKGLYKTSLQRSTGSLDRDSSGSLGQRSVELLGTRMSTESLDHACSGSAIPKSRDSLHRTSLGSSEESPSSSVTDHLAPSVSEIERRLTDLIGRGEGVGGGCVIRSDDTSGGHQTTGQGLTHMEETEQEVEKPGNVEKKNTPKSSLKSDTGKCGEEDQLKHRGSEGGDEVSVRSASIEEDSLEKSTTEGSSRYWTTSTEGENTTEMTTNDSSSSTKSFTLDSLAKTDSLSFTESPQSASRESDSLNQTRVRSENVRHSPIAERRRSLAVRQTHMLFGTGTTRCSNSSTMDSQASAPTSHMHEAISTTMSGLKTEYDSDGTWTDDSEYRSSGTERVADSEHEDSEDVRPSNSKECHHGSNRRFKGINRENVSGLLGLLDTNLSVNHETAPAIRTKEKATGADVKTMAKHSRVCSKTKILSDGTTQDKTDDDNAEDTGLTTDDKRQTSSKRVRHATGYYPVKEDEALTSAEKDINRKTSEEDQSNLADIDPDSLREDIPFVSPNSTNPNLARAEEPAVYNELALPDFSQLMLQVSRSHKSDSSLPMFVSPAHSRIITRNDITSQFLASSELDKELHSPEPSATQLSWKSESMDMTEEFRSTLDSASVDDTEEGFVTPDEERSLSPDVEDWLFDLNKPIMEDVISELNLVELISLSSRSATPLISYDADSLGSPSNQTLVDSGSRCSQSTRVAGFVSPEQSKMRVAEAVTPVNFESEPVNSAVPQPHSQMPIEDASDRDLEVTSSDEAEQDLANEQSPEKRVHDVLKEEKLITPVADVCRSSEDNSVNEITCVDNATSQSGLSALGASSKTYFCNKIFSQVVVDNSDDDTDDRAMSTARLVSQPEPCGQHMPESNCNDVTVPKQEPTSPLKEPDLNNCSSTDSILVKDTRSDQSCRGKLLMHSEVSSSEDDLSIQPDSMLTYGELQKEIIDVIGPVLGTAPTVQGAPTSAMSEMLKLAFSRSLQTAITGCVVTEDTSGHTPAMDMEEAGEDSVKNSVPDSAQSRPVVMSCDKPGDQSSDTSSNQVFSPHAPVSQTWSNLVESETDLRGGLTTVVEQDETSRSSDESSQSVKSSDIDVSETDSDKSMRTKRMTTVAWDADISSQSETEGMLPRDSGFVSSTNDPGLNVTILGQSECSSQDNLCKDVTKAWDHVGKFILPSYDTLSVPLTDTPNVAPVSSDVDECGKKCTTPDITTFGLMPQLCTDIEVTPLASSDMPSVLSKRETNISRPGSSKTTWKLARPPSLLAVVAEDDAEEKSDTLASQEHNGTMPSHGAVPSFRQSESTPSSGTFVPELRMNNSMPLVSSKPDNALYASVESSVNLSEMNVSSDSSVRHSTDKSSMTVEPSGSSSEVAQPTFTSLPTMTERKRNPSGIPLLKRPVKPNIDFLHKNFSPSKVPQTAGQMASDCKTAANGTDLCQKSSLQKAVLIVAAASSETSQRIDRKPNSRHPSAPQPQSRSQFKSNVTSSNDPPSSEPICKKSTTKLSSSHDLSNIEPIAKKSTTKLSSSHDLSNIEPIAKKSTTKLSSSHDPSSSDVIAKKPTTKLTKATAKFGDNKQTDEPHTTLAPARQRYASVGMPVASSTRTRIPSAVSLRALSYDRNVQARVDSRFAEYCSPRPTSSLADAKESKTQNRSPGKTHSARSTSKLNRHINKLSTSQLPSKRLSKSVDSLNRVERLHVKVGRVASEVKATKLSTRKTASKEVVKTSTEAKAKISVKVPDVGVLPVMTSIQNDTGKIDANCCKKEEHETSVAGADSAEGQSKKLAESKPVAKAVISIQTEFQLKKIHKKKQKRKAESSKRNKSKYSEEVSESDVQVTTSESEVVDAELTGTSLSKKNSAEKPSPHKVEKKSVSTSAEVPHKHSIASAIAPFKITLRHSEQDFTSSSGRSMSPSGSQERVGSPGSSSKRVHYNVEIVSTENEQPQMTLTNLLVAHTDELSEPKKDESEIKTVDGQEEGEQLGATEEGAMTDELELVIFGKALKLLKSPVSMKVKSIHLEHNGEDHSPIPARVVRSTDMYIVHASTQLNDKNGGSEKLSKPAPSTDVVAVEPPVVRPIPQLSEPPKRSPASPVVDIANIRSEMRYSDGQIKRDNPKESTLVDTASDGNMKTKIPSRKVFVCASKTSLPEVSITRSDEVSVMNMNASMVRNVQRNKFPPTLTKAMSDMVISKTDDISEDIVHQLCKNMPEAGKQPSGTSQVPGKPTPKKDDNPETKAADTDNVETGKPKADVQLAKKRSKKRRCVHSHQSTGSASPASSVKSLIQSGHQHPTSGTSQQAMTQSEKSSSQPSLTQTGMSPTCQPLVTQSSKSPTCQPPVTLSSVSPICVPSVTLSSMSPTCQPSVTLSSMSPTCQPSVTKSSTSSICKPSVTQFSKSPTRHLSLTQSGKSPTRHLSLTQSVKSSTYHTSLKLSGKSPTRHPSLTQSTRSPTQPSPIKSNRSPTRPELNDVVSRQTSAAAEKCHEDLSERPQLVQDKRSKQIPSHIDGDDTKSSIGSSQKTAVQRPRKPESGNYFSTTVLPSWQELSKLLEMDSDEIRYDDDSQCGVSSSDIVAILQKFHQSDTPEGMSDDKVLDSTLVTAASVIIQTRDIVMQQLTNDGDSGDITGVDGRTDSEQNSDKKDCDNKMENIARAANLHTMKKDAEDMLTCVAKTSNDILNYMSADKIDVTAHLLRQLQQDESKDSCDSLSSSNTSLYPTKVEPESWMSLTGQEISGKCSDSSIYGQKSKKSHKKKHGKKLHSSTHLSSQIKPVDALQHPLVKKLLNISYLQTGSEKPGSYISTLHKKTTLKKLMDMKNPRAQVKKLLQKSQENISLGRKDMEELKQGPLRRSRKLGGMNNKDRGWRANWDDVATAEPLPVIKKKRSCSGTSSIRSRISNLSATKRRSQSAINSPSKMKTQLPGNSDVTTVSQTMRSNVAKQPLCVDLKLLLNNSENAPDDLAVSPCSTLTSLHLQQGGVTAGNNPLTHLPPKSDLIPCKKVSSSGSDMDSPRWPVQSPYKDNHYMEIPLPSETSSSYSSVTSKAYFSAENVSLPNEGKKDVSAASKVAGGEPPVSVAVEQKDIDSKEAQSLEHIVTKQELSPENSARSAITRPVEAPAAANSGNDSIDSKPVVHQIVEPKGEPVECMPVKQQVVSCTNKDNENTCLIPKMHPYLGGRRHPSTGSKTSASVDTINWPPKKPLSASSKDNFSVQSLNMTPEGYSSTESLQNSLFANVTAGRHSTVSNSWESVSADRRNRQISSPEVPLAKPTAVRSDLSSRSASPQGRDDRVTKKAPQHCVISKTELSPAYATTAKQEIFSSKENASAFSLSALPKLAINLGAAAIDKLLPSSIRSSMSSDANRTGASVKSADTQLKSAPSQHTDRIEHIPEHVATNSGHNKTASMENLIPKSSAVQTHSHSKCKTQPTAGLKGIKCKDSSMSTKPSPSKTHKEAAKRPGKTVIPKKPTTNGQLRRSSTTVKKPQPPQKKRQVRHRKPAANEERLPVKRIAAKNVLSLDSELNVLRNMLNSEFGSSSESSETVTSSKVSTTSVISSTDDLSLSEPPTDRSTSPMVDKTTRRIGHAVAFSRKSPVEGIKGRPVIKNREDRGEPQMRDTTTDPMFAWHMPSQTHIQCPTLPYPTGQQNLHQYKSSYPYTASSEIVESLTELEYFISELSLLVESKNVCRPTEAPLPNKAKLSASNSSNADIVDSFFDIATFASNLATSFEEISSASEKSLHKVSWTENMRAKALLNKTHLGRIYLQQIAKSSAMREAMDIAKIEETVSDNNDEFSDDQFVSTDYTYSSSSTATSASSRASVITPQQSKLLSNASPGVYIEDERVKKPEVDHLPNQLANGGSDSQFNTEAPIGSCPAKHECAAMHDSTQENNVDDTTRSTASEIDFLSFVSDSGDKLADVIPLSGNASTQQPQCSRQPSSTSSNRETRGIKRKGTMTVEKTTSKDMSTSGFNKPSGPLVESHHSQMPSLQQMTQNHALNLIESSLLGTKNRFVLRDSSETSSCATHSAMESAASKQLSDSDVFNLFFTYLGPEKAHAYLEKSASLSSSVKPPMLAVDPGKKSAMESMCPSRGSSLLSNNTGVIDVMHDGSHVSSYSKPSSHMTPVSLIPSDSVLMRDAMQGDRVGLPSTALLNKVEMFYDQKMNGTGNEVDLTQFMQWFHSGSSSSSPAERALHSALRYYQSRPDGDVQPSELTTLPTGTTKKSAVSEEQIDKLIYLH